MTAEKKAHEVGSLGGGAVPLCSLEFAFPSSPDYLPLVRNVVRWSCEKAKFSEVESSRIVLALVEAVTNVIRHAYRGDPCRRIVLRIGERKDGLEFELLDDGLPAAGGLVAAERRDAERPGGYGVRLISKCMDEVRYEPRDGGGSRLVLAKRRSVPCPGSEEDAKP